MTIYVYDENMGKRTIIRHANLRLYFDSHNGLWRKCGQMPTALSFNDLTHIQIKMGNGGGGRHGQQDNILLTRLEVGR